MVTGILGKKIGMTQLFGADGAVTPATVIKAGPCVVVQRKTVERDGYDAVQLGLVEDSPAKVNRNRWDALEATGQSKVVTACPGCHRMLGAARSAEGELTDIANVLYDRVKANRAAKSAAEGEDGASE